MSGFALSPLVALRDRMIRGYLAEKLSHIFVDSDEDLLRANLHEGRLVLERKELVPKTMVVTKYKYGFELRKGVVGRLAIEVPWSALRQESTSVVMSDVFLFLAPPEQELSTEDEAVRSSDEASKQAKLAVVELLSIAASRVAPPPGILEAILSSVVGNLTASIVNLHIQFEDAVTQKSAPFTWGIVIGRVSVRPKADGQRSIDISGMSFYMMPNTRAPANPMRCGTSAQFEEYMRSPFEVRSNKWAAETKQAEEVNLRRRRTAGGVQSTEEAPARRRKLAEDAHKLTEHFAIRPTDLQVTATDGKRCEHCRRSGATARCESCSDSSTKIEFGKVEVFLDVAQRRDWASFIEGFKMARTRRTFMAFRRKHFDAAESSMRAFDWARVRWGFAIDATIQANRLRVRLPLDLPEPNPGGTSDAMRTAMRKRRWEYLDARRRGRLEYIELYSRRLQHLEQAHSGAEQAGGAVWQTGSAMWGAATAAGVAAAGAAGFQQREGDAQWGEAQQQRLRDLEKDLSLEDAILYRQITRRGADADALARDLASSGMRSLTDAPEELSPGERREQWRRQLQSVVQEQLRSRSMVEVTLEIRELCVDWLADTDEGFRQGIVGLLIRAANPDGHGLRPGVSVHYTEKQDDSFAVGVKLQTLTVQDTHTSDTRFKELMWSNAETTAAAFVDLQLKIDNKDWTVAGLRFHTGRSWEEVPTQTTIRCKIGQADTVYCPALMQRISTMLSPPKTRRIALTTSMTPEAARLPRIRNRINVGRTQSFSDLSPSESGPDVFGRMMTTAGATRRRGVSGDTTSPNTYTEAATTTELNISVGEQFVAVCSDVSEEVPVLAIMVGSIDAHKAPADHEQLQAQLFTPHLRDGSLRDSFTLNVGRTTLAISDAWPQTSGLDRSTEEGETVGVGIGSLHEAAHSQPEARLLGVPGFAIAVEAPALPAGMLANLADSAKAVDVRVIERLDVTLDHAQLQLCKQFAENLDSGRSSSAPKRAVPPPTATDDVTIRMPLASLVLRLAPAEVAHEISVEVSSTEVRRTHNLLRASVREIRVNMADERHQIAEVVLCRANLEKSPREMSLSVRSVDIRDSRLRDDENPRLPMLAMGSQQQDGSGDAVNVHWQELADRKKLRLHTSATTAVLDPTMLAELLSLQRALVATFALFPADESHDPVPTELHIDMPTLETLFDVKVARVNIRLVEAAPAELQHSETQRWSGHCAKLLLDSCTLTDLADSERMDEVTRQVSVRFIQAGTDTKIDILKIGAQLQRTERGLEPEPALLLIRAVSSPLATEWRVRVQQPTLELGATSLKPLHDVVIGALGALSTSAGQEPVAATPELRYPSPPRAESQSSFTYPSSPRASEFSSLATPQQFATPPAPAARRETVSSPPALIESTRIRLDVVKLSVCIRDDDLMSSTALMLQCSTSISHTTGGDTHTEAQLDDLQLTLLAGKPQTSQSLLACGSLSFRYHLDGAAVAVRTPSKLDIGIDRPIIVQLGARDVLNAGSVVSSIDDWSGLLKAMASSVTPQRAETQEPPASASPIQVSLRSAQIEEDDLQVDLYSECAEAPVLRITTKLELGIEVTSGDHQLGRDPQVRVTNHLKSCGMKLLNTSLSSWEPLLESCSLEVVFKQSLISDDCQVRVRSDDVMNFNITSTVAKMAVDTQQAISRMKDTGDGGADPRRWDLLRREVHRVQSPRAGAGAGGAPTTAQRLSFCIKNDTGQSLFFKEAGAEEIELGADSKELPLQHFLWSDHTARRPQNLCLRLVGANPVDLDVSRTGEQHVEMVSEATQVSLVCETVARSGGKLLVVRSPVLLINGCESAVQVKLGTELVATIKPGATTPLPVRLTKGAAADCKIQARRPPSGNQSLGNVNANGYGWSVAKDSKALSAVVGSANHHFTAICHPIDGSSACMYWLISAVQLQVPGGVTDQLLDTDQSQTHQSQTHITVSPPLRVHNLLPIECQFCVSGFDDASTTYIDLPSAVSKPVHHVDVQAGMLFLHVSAGGRRTEDGVELKTGESRIALTARGGEDANETQWLQMEVEIDRQSGFISVTLFVSYWLVDNASLPGQCNVEFQTAKSPEPLKSPARLHNFVLHMLASDPDTESENIIRVRVQGASAWSDEIDARKTHAIELSSSTQEMAGTGQFSIGVSTGAAPAPFQRTRIVTFAPRYMVTNHTGEVICIKQFGFTGQGESLQPNQSQPFHWSDSGGRRKLYVKMHNREWSGPVDIDTQGDVALNMHDINTRLNSIGRVSVKPGEHGTNFVAFYGAEKVDPPMRIDNRTSMDLTVKQKATLNNSAEYRVDQMRQMSYAWDESYAEHTLELKWRDTDTVVYVAVDDPEFEPITTKILDASSGDCSIKVLVEQQGPTRVIAIESNGMQRAPSLGSSHGRILLRQQRHANPVNREVTLQLAGIGFSLIDQADKMEPVELVYVALHTLRWDVRQKLQGNSQDCETLTFSAGHIQVDNQLAAEDSQFAVALTPQKTEPSDPFCRFEVERLHDMDIPHFSVLKTDLQNVRIMVDGEHLARVMDLNSPGFMRASWNTSVHHKAVDVDDILREQCSLAGSQIVAQAKKQQFLFDQLQISPFVLNAKNSGSPSRFSTDGFEKIWLEVQEFNQSQVFATGEELTKRLTSNYLAAANSYFLVLLGSAHIFGNPLGLLSKLKADTRNLVVDTTTAAITDPRSWPLRLQEGLFRLGFTILTHTSSMLCQWSEILGGDASDHAGFIDSFGDLHAMAWGQPVRRFGLVKGVLLGVDGFFRLPIGGARSSGILGLVSGVFWGSVALVFRPVAGVIAFQGGVLSRLSTKLGSEGTGREFRRIRPGREFLDGILVPMSDSDRLRSRLSTFISEHCPMPGDNELQFVIQQLAKSSQVLCATRRRLFLFQHSGAKHADVYDADDDRYKLRWQATACNIASITADPRLDLCRVVICALETETEKGFRVRDAASPVPVAQNEVQAALGRRMAASARPPLLNHSILLRLREQQTIMVSRLRDWQTS